MNYRRGKQVARCSNDAGTRRYRLERPDDYESINAAKRANGLNATTCQKFPPSIDELHEEALGEQP